MIEEPLVSIVITTYDRPEMLKNAIEKCLEQDYGRIEILVVDHSGEDYARNIVEGYEGVEYLATSEELGQIAAWNGSFHKVSGDYIQFHDDDDWLKPSKIRKQVDFLEQKKDIGVVYCGIESEKGEVLLPVEGNRGDVTKQVLRQDLERCQTTTMLIDSSLLAEVIPLHEFGNVGDLALEIELSQVTEFDYLEEALLTRTLHHDSSGNSLLNRRKRIELIDYYSELYDEYPEIKRETIVETNMMLALKLFEQNIWSLEAIMAFFTILRYKDGAGIRDYNRFFSSFFGRPGFKLGESVYHNYLSKL